MLRLGDWVTVGERSGAVQSYGIERGFSPRGGQPVVKASRRKALLSNMPMILIYFSQNCEEWWPLDACVPCPPPLAKKRDFMPREAPLAEDGRDG